MLRISDCPNRQRGIVLPVVLVMLVLMTAVVLFTSRRSAIDERLAANVRGVVSLDTAAQYALRWCEMWIWVSPPGIAPDAGLPEPPRVFDSPAGIAAWTVAANWANEAVTLPASAMTGNTDVVSAECLIENATGELETVSKYQGGSANAEDRMKDATTAQDNVWRKFRITSQVEATNASFATVSRAQSEIRMPIF